MSWGLWRFWIWRGNIVSKLQTTCQITKFKSSPHFPAIRYIVLSGLSGSWNRVSCMSIPFSLAPTFHVHISSPTDPPLNLTHIWRAIPLQCVLAESMQLAPLILEHTYMHACPFVSKPFPLHVLYTGLSVCPAPSWMWSSLWVSCLSTWWWSYLALTPTWCPLGWSVACARPGCGWVS